MKIVANKFEPKDLIKFIREYTGKTQKDFAEDINKSKDWEQSNELGRSNYYFKDLLDICKKNNLDIIVKEHEK